MSIAWHLAEDLLASSEIRELVNDLSQPLSSIEAIAYYVEMTLPAEQLQSQHYMQHIQELADETNSILKRFASNAAREHPIGSAVTY